MTHIVTKRTTHLNGVEHIRQIGTELYDRHNLSGPAYIEQYPNGVPHIIGYWEYDVPHRVGGPQFIERDQEDNLLTVLYIQNDVAHRPEEEGPAKYFYYLGTNQLRCVQYCWQGKFHRRGGPAIIRYNRDGSICFEGYCLNGVEITEQEWRRQCRKTGETTEVETWPDLVPKRVTVSRTVGGHVYQVTTWYDKHGHIWKKRYTRDRALHRTTGPAEIWWHDNHVRSRVVFAEYGRMQRKNGGHYLITFDRRGVITSIESDKGVKYA